MPTYEYECSKCGHRFEKLQGISAEPLKTCPKCGKDELVRLIGAGSGIIFKGAGFYANDYQKKKEKKPPPACPSRKEGSCEGCSLNPKKDNA